MVCVGYVHGPDEAEVQKWLPTLQVGGGGKHHWVHRDGRRLVVQLHLQVRPLCLLSPPQCDTLSWRKALRPSSPLNPVAVSNGVGNQRLTNASTRTPLGISRKERSAPAPGRRRCAPADCGPR